MVFAVIFEFHSDEKRAAVAALGGVPLGRSAMLLDLPDTTARSVRDRIVGQLCVRTGLETNALLASGEVIYVLPLELELAGGGSEAVDTWLARRRLLLAESKRG